MCNHARLAQHPMSETRRLHHETMPRGNQWIQSYQLPKTPSQSEFHPLKIANEDQKKIVRAPNSAPFSSKRMRSHDEHCPARWLQNRQRNLDDPCGSRACWALNTLKYHVSPLHGGHLMVLRMFQASMSLHMANIISLKPDDQKEHSKTFGRNHACCKPCFW